MSRGLSLWRSDFEECLEDSRTWGDQILTELDHAVTLGGSAKEKPSRVWGGSGVGAELRSELRSEPQSEWSWCSVESDFEECLEDCCSRGQLLINVSRIVALDVRD